ncbi:MAG: hypothetical protein RLP09_10085 [Sandaracinaceae bacterium]
MIQALHGAAGAMIRHGERFAEAAAETERAVRPLEDRVTLSGPSLTDATVDRIEAPAGFRANLAVLQTAEDMARELTKAR